MVLKRTGSGVAGGANVVVLNLTAGGEGVLNLAACGAGVLGLNKKLGVDVVKSAGAGVVSAGVVGNLLGAGVVGNLLVGTTGATVGMGGKGAGALNLAGVNN